jgi:NAD(P)H-flavin reductase
MPTHKLHLQERRHLGGDVYVLRFDRPPNFAFVPGQYIRFSTGGVKRDYTLISPPEGADLEICLRLIPEGRFSPLLIEAPVGQAYTVDGPLGYFHFQSEPQMAIFLATGTGVAPFLAFARAGVRGFTLFHGAASPEGLYFSEELRAAAGTYKACVSGTVDSAAEAGPPWICQGRITDLLAAMPPRPYHFYLCGGGGMVRDAVLTIDQRFPEAVVFTEPFY